MLAALLAASATATAGGFDGMPLMQFGNNVYEPIYPCDLVVSPGLRRLTLYCNGPTGPGVAVLTHPNQQLEGPAVATGWRVEALLATQEFSSHRFEAEGCELLAPNDVRCDGFSDGFEP